MDLKGVLISDIKNLELIYIYSYDSIFKNDTNKYIGAKVVYNNNKILSLDYKDKFFETFIRKILETYNIEKDSRKIILLGSLTKKLINESSFDVLKKENVTGNQNKGLAMFNSFDRYLIWFKNILKEAIKVIISYTKNYETFNITSIDGYNHKFFINYNIGSVKKSIPIIISQLDYDTISFRLNIIDKTLNSIEGKIENDCGKITIDWTDKNNIEGHIEYTAQNNKAEKRIDSQEEVLYLDNTLNSITMDDTKIIDFYYNLCQLNKPSHILKINESSFVLTDEELISNEKEGKLYKKIGSQIELDKNNISIKYSIKNGFNKYDDQIRVTLDQDTVEIIISKICIDNKYYLLMEKKFKNNFNSSYSYSIIEVNCDLDLTKPFDIINTKEIKEEIIFLDDVKKYVLRGGK